MDEKLSLKGPAAGADKNQVRTVQSIERGFAIIELISRSEHALTLAEISKAIGLHTSTTFHLLRTLCVIGPIKQDADKKYRIGPYIYGLAASAQTEANLVADALPHLEWLANETGETTHVAVMANDAVVILARCEGKASVRLSERIGSQRPAYCTALGKTLLSQLPDKQVDDYLAKTPLDQITESTIVSRDRLRAELREAKAAGAAYDDREFNAEVRCVAAPVRNYSGKVIAALGLSGPIWRVTLQQLPDLTKKVIKAANMLSADLGYDESKAAKLRA